MSQGVLGAKLLIWSVAFLSAMGNASGTVTPSESEISLRHRVVRSHALNLCEAALRTPLAHVAGHPASSENLLHLISRLQDRTNEKTWFDGRESRDFPFVFDVRGDVSRLSADDARASMNLISEIWGSMVSPKKEISVWALEIVGSEQIGTAYNAILETSEALTKSYGSLARLRARKFPRFDATWTSLRLATYAYVAVVDTLAIMQAKFMFTQHPLFALPVYVVAYGTNHYALKLWVSGFRKSGDKVGNLRRDVKSLLARDAQSDFLSLRSSFYEVPAEFHDLLISETNDPSSARLGAVLMNSGVLKRLAFAVSSRDGALAADVAHAGRPLRQVRFTDLMYKDPGTGEPVWLIVYQAHSPSRTGPPRLEPMESFIREVGLQPSF